MPDETPNTPNTAPESTPTPDANTEEKLLGGTPDDKLLGEKPADKTEAPKPEDKTEEVKYEFKDAPEGYDTEALAKFAKENGITPAAAQKLIERDVANQTAMQERLNESFKELQTKGWIAELKADPAFKKDWAAAVQTARRGNDALPPAIKAEIDKLGLNNNPVLFKIAHFLGEKLKEDSFVRGNSATGKERAFHEVMYAPDK